MLRVGLTGGIGAGKSTVAAGLVERGAVLVDGDAIAREILTPGGPAYAPVVGRFGPSVVADGGGIDRPALAAVVFADAAARADLNAIMHPLIGGIMLQRVDAWTGTDRVVVLDIPLLQPGSASAYGLELVVVVDVPEDIAVARLVAHRGFSEEDARARVAAQITRAERVALADVVIDNSGTPAELGAQVARLSDDLARRAAGCPRPPDVH